MDQSFQGWFFFFKETIKAPEEIKSKPNTRSRVARTPKVKPLKGLLPQGERYSHWATNCVCALSDPPTLGFT